MLQSTLSPCTRAQSHQALLSDALCAAEHAPALPKGMEDLDCDVLAAKEAQLSPPKPPKRKREAKPKSAKGKAHAPHPDLEVGPCTLCCVLLHLTAAQLC